MNFPSKDQSLAAIILLPLNSSSSLLLPSAGFTYSCGRPVLAELKTILLPSGDHTGEKSQAGSTVNREGVLRAMSISQMSPLPFSSRSTATLFSSGESHRDGWLPTGP